VMTAPRTGAPRYCTASAARRRSTKDASCAGENPRPSTWRWRPVPSSRLGYSSARPGATRASCTAASPTMTEPSASMATADGVRYRPAPLGTGRGRPRSTTAVADDTVPKSIPMSRLPSVLSTQETGSSGIQRSSASSRSWAADQCGGPAGFCQATWAGTPSGDDAAGGGTPAAIARTRSLRANGAGSPRRATRSCRRTAGDAPRPATACRRPAGREGLACVPRWPRPAPTCTSPTPPTPATPCTGAGCMPRSRLAGGPPSLRRGG
jgi:hypothetical protein